MIYINRETVSSPEILQSDRLEKELMEMHEFFSHAEKAKQKRYRYKSQIYNNGEVKTALKELFHHKCAYCESREENMNVDQFRPKGGSMDLEGNFDPLHYYWLAYEWTNLYLSCPSCNMRYKRNFFPVDGSRAAVNSDISSEQAMLLDPCSLADFMEEHITFEGAEAIPLSERAEITINLLGLNRDILMKRREEALKDISLKIQHYQDQDNQKKQAKTLKKIIEDELSPDREYLACKWANFQEDLKEILAPADYLPYLSRKSIFPGYSKEKKRTEYHENIAAQENFSLDKLKSKDISAYFSTSRWIDKVEIKNFKILEHLVLEFPKLEDSPLQPWMVILGENGTGKSSILQAIALTLAGEKRANALGLDASKFVNRDAKESKGWVKVYLNQRKDPLSLHFKRSSKKFTVNPKDPQFIVRGYGATRLLSKDAKKERNDYIYLDNLFDPYTQLENVQKWLGDPGMVDESLFLEISRSLSELLSLDEEHLFFRETLESGKHQVYLQINPQKGPVPLEHLSDGYKAIIGLALDIMVGVSKMWKSIFNAQGIILIDEIGVHLHPRWKMRIVSALRNTFPEMSFVISTHEPLCLRGLEKGEVILIQLDEAKDIEVITDLPNPREMRVGQLLTSVFGLSTTMDPELEPFYNEYYGLLGLAERTEDEEKRMLELKEKLNPDLMLGETVRDRMFYEVVEKELAQFKKSKSKSDISTLQKNTLDEVRDLWKKSVD